MTKSMTDTESILRSVDMSVSGLSAIPLVLKGLSSLHNWTNVSSRSVMKGILPHRFSVVLSAIGGPRNHPCSRYHWTVLANPSAKRIGDGTVRLLGRQT